MFENSYKLNYQELNFELANRIYELIRQSDEDICKIVSNIEFRTNNIIINLYQKPFRTSLGPEGPRGVWQKTIFFHVFF